MAGKPDPKEETAEEKAERLHVEAVQKIRDKMADAPHPKTVCLTDTDLALLPHREAAGILASRKKQAAKLKKRARRAERSRR